MPEVKTNGLSPTAYFPTSPILPTLYKSQYDQTQLLEKIIQLVPGLITVYNIHSGKYIYVNCCLTHILGYSQASLLKGGLNFAISLVHPDDLEKLMIENTAVLKKANSQRSRRQNLSPVATFEYRMKHKNGSWKWLHTTGIVFDRNELGGVEHVMNISIDITKRKRAEIRETSQRKSTEDNLRKSEGRFRALLEHSADAITLIDQSGSRIYATPSRKNILGYDNNQDLGKSVFDYVHPDDKNEVQRSFREILSQPALSKTMTFRILHQKGCYIWIEAAGTNLLHIPQIKAVLVNYRDVTDRKLAEDRIQFMENASNILISSIDYETTLKNIASLIVPQLADFCRIAILNNGQIKEVSVNHANPKKLALVKKLYKVYKDDINTTYGINQILKTGLPELIPTLTQEVLKPFKDNKGLLKTIKMLKIKSYMGVPLKVRGKIIGAMTFSSTRDDMIYNQNNLNLAQELAYLVAMALDNAKLFSNEQTAVRLRDQFISVASHELKTPITSMKGFIQILQNRQQDPLTGHYLSRVNDQMSRLTNLINDLLDVSRVQRGKLPLQKEPIELKPFLQEIITDFQLLIQNHFIKLEIKKDVQIRVDRYRLSQVMINLLTNAVKYSPKSPQVNVSVTSSTSQVKISVQDFGIGIFSKHLNKIFDPFYQAETKVRQSFGGLGLGLHISQEIVHRHGGKILVKSQKGKGSTFTVILPIK